MFIVKVIHLYTIAISVYRTRKKWGDTNICTFNKYI